MTETTLQRPDRTRAQIEAKTLRTDRWWTHPALLATFLTLWVIYATVRAFMQKWYYVSDYHYLTPFSSPCLSKGCVPEASHFGRFLPDWPILPYAAITLVFLLGFRLTCYYYRKTYYRAFWQAPTACAVREPHAKYTGERRFPLILQNLHRYFFWLAVLISLVNTWDAIVAFHGKNGGVGLGLGTIIMVVNVVLLWAYTLSCHSCRHVMGGKLKHFSKHPVRYWAWQQVTKLNTRHGVFGLVTLGTLALTDLYIMLVSAGVFSDLRIFN